MRTARAVGVLGVVLAGLVALGLLGEGMGPIAVLAAMLVLLAPILRSRSTWLPWQVLTLAVVAGVLLRVWLGGSPEAGLGLALGYLQVHRRLIRRGPSDDRVSALLSGLMLVAASRTESPLYLLAIAPWVAALPLALLPEVSRRVPLPRGVLLLPIGTLVVGGGLFPLLPRPGSPTRPEVVARTGFAPDVELGALDLLLDDPAEVFRVTPYPPLQETVYFRGAALDAFDGRRWSSTSEARVQTLQAPRHYPAEAVSLQFVAGPGTSDALFTAGRVLHVTGDGPLLRDEQGAWRLGARDREAEMRYELVVLPPLGPGAVTPEDVGETGPFVQLPPLDPRVQALADGIAPEEVDPLRLAEAMARFVRDRHEYTRAPGDDGVQEPLSTFLIERRSGHCEHFASALAVLLRARGVPARLVSGFAGGDLDPATEELVVRRYHAHAWVEVLGPDGWVLVDPTPGPGASLGPPERSLLDRFRGWWTTDLLGWDGQAQRDVLVAAGRRVEALLFLPPAPRLPWKGLGLLLSACLAAGLLARGVALRAARRLAGEAPPAPRGPVARWHGRARRHLERKGWRVPAALPPVEAARWVGRRAPGPEAAALEELAWLLYAVRFGGEDEGAAASRARSLAEQVMRLGPPQAIDEPCTRR